MNDSLYVFVVLNYVTVSNKEDWEYLCDRFSSEEFKVKFVMNNHSNIFLIEYFTNYMYIIFP